MIFSDLFWDVLHWFSYTSYSQIPSSVEGTGLSWKVPSWDSHIYIRTTRIRDMNLVRVWFIFERLVLVPFWQKFRCTQCNLYTDPNQFYFLTNPNSDWISTLIQTYTLRDTHIYGFSNHRREPPAKPACSPTVVGDGTIRTGLTSWFEYTPRMGSRCNPIWEIKF